MRSDMRSASRQRLWTTLAMIQLLAGCLALPTQSSRSAADLAPHLSPELLASHKPVLVLAQYSTTKRRGLWAMEDYKTWDTTIFFTARLVPGTELAELNKSIVQTSSSGLWLMMYPGIGGTQQTQGDELLRLCLISTDGIERNLRPAGGTWDEKPARIIHTARRDALVAALRANDQRPFDRIDGPCGIAGKVSWTPELRAQAVSLLAKLPEQAAMEQSSPFDALARKAYSSGARDDKMLVLAAGRWRDRAVGNPPIFLDDADFADFAKIASRAIAADLLVFFPDHIAAHWSGSRALDSLDIANFCVIRRTGEALYWSSVTGGWKQLEPQPPYRDWQQEALGILTGAEKPGLPADSCVAATPQNWSQADLTRVRAFIEALPVQEAPHAAANVLADLLLSIELGGSANASALVMVENVSRDKRNTQNHLTFFTLAAAREQARIAQVLASVPPEHLPRALGMKAEQRTATRVCVIAASGAVNRFSKLDERNAWGAPAVSRVDANMRSATMLALGTTQELGTNEMPVYYGGFLPCGVERGYWFERTSKERVRRFLERIAVSASEGSSKAGGF